MADLLTDKENSKENVLRLGSKGLMRRSEGGAIHSIQRTPLSTLNSPSTVIRNAKQRRFTTSCPPTSHFLSPEISASLESLKEYKAKSGILKIPGVEAGVKIHQKDSKGITENAALQNKHNVMAPNLKTQDRHILSPKNAMFVSRLKKPKSVAKYIKLPDPTELISLEAPADLSKSRAKATKKKIPSVKKKTTDLKGEVSRQAEVIRELKRQNEALKSAIAKRNREPPLVHSLKKESEDKSGKEEVKWSDTVKDLEQQLEHVKIQLRLLKPKASEENKQDMVKRFKQQAADFEQALKVKEQDLAAITMERDNLRCLLDFQSAAIEQLHNVSTQAELYKAEICKLKEEIKKVEKSATEAQEFLEQERNALKEELLEKEELLKKTRSKVQILTEENEALMQTITNIKQQYKELSLDLDETKRHAGDMLLRQNSELVQAEIAVSNLVLHVTNFHHELEQCFEKETCMDPCSSPQVQDTNTCTSTRKSFVYTVLNSVKNKFHQTKLESACSDTELFQQSENKKLEEQNTIGKLEFTDDSSDDDVAGCNDNNNDQNSGDDAMPPSVSESSSVEEMSHSNKLELENYRLDPLSKQISGVDVVIQNLVVMFKNLYEVLKDHELKLYKKIEIINEHSAKEKMSLNSLVNSLRTEIEQVNARRKDLHHSLMEAHKQLEHKEEVLKEANQMILERTETVETLINQLRMLKKQEKDFSRMVKLLEEKDRELMIIKETMDADLEKIGEKYGILAKSSIKELIYLRKENASLYDQNLQLENEKETLLEKFNKRVKVYKSNWAKAEEEVARLDDLLDRIRQACIMEMDVLKKSCTFQPVLQELDLLSA